MMCHPSALSSSPIYVSGAAAGVDPDELALLVALGLAFGFCLRPGPGIVVVLN